MNLSANVFFKLFYVLSYKNLSSEISERKKYKLPTYKVPIYMYLLTF